jgi:serine/threonine protein kinase
LHRFKVAHRDIKPEHLRVYDNQLALIDFDLAVVEPAPIARSHVGTKGFRLWEVNECYNMYTADVYAAACSFKELYDSLAAEEQSALMMQCLDALKERCENVPDYAATDALALVQECMLPCACLKCVDMQEPSVVALLPTPDIQSSVDAEFEWPITQWLRMQAEAHAARAAPPSPPSPTSQDYVEVKHGSPPLLDDAPRSSYPSPVSSQ